MFRESNLVRMRQLVDADPGEDLIGYAGASREAIAYLVEHGALPVETEEVTSTMYAFPRRKGDVGRERTFVFDRPLFAYLTKPFLEDFFNRHGIPCSVESGYDALAGARIRANHYSIRHRLNLHYDQKLGSNPPSPDSLPEALRSELIDECEINGAGVVLALRRHVAELVEIPLIQQLEPQKEGGLVVGLSSTLGPDLSVLVHHSFLGLPLKQGKRLGMEDFSSIIPLSHGDREFLGKLR